MKYMTEKFCVVMDSKEELALLVHMPNKIVKFRQLSNEIYATDKNNEKGSIIIKKQYQFMNKLEENLNFPSLRQKSGKEI